MAAATQEISNKLTKEQKEKAAKAAEMCIEACERETKLVKADEDGLDTILLAFEEGSGCEESKDNEKKEDEKKEDEKVVTIWDQFKEAAKATREWAQNFLEQLKKAPISNATKTKIAKVCREYRDLLNDTSLKIQKYRFEVEKMVDCFENIIELMVPPSEVKDDLEGLTDQDRIKKINEFVNENKDELSKQFTLLSQLLKDKKSVNELKNLQGKWKEFAQNIEDVIKDVSQELKELRKSLGIGMGIGLTFAAILGGLTVILSAGILTPVVGAALSTAGAFSVGFLAVAGLACVGMAAFGIYMLINPQVANKLQKVKDETIGAISDGLEKIAAQGSRMETMLGEMYKTWLELEHSDPQGNEQLKTRFGRKINCEKLVSKMNKSKQALQKLIKQVKDTEQCCDTELENYTETLYKPLLQLYAN